MGNLLGGRYSRCIDTMNEVVWSNSAARLCCSRSGNDTHRSNEGQRKQRLPRFIDGWVSASNRKHRGSTINDGWVTRVSESNRKQQHRSIIDGWVTRAAVSQNFFCVVVVGSFRLSTVCGFRE